MASEKIVKFVEEIKTLTVLELADLVKAIEEEFGVSAVAAAPAAAAYFHAWLFFKITMVPLAGAVNTR